MAHSCTTSDNGSLLYILLLLELIGNDVQQFPGGKGGEGEGEGEGITKVKGEGGGKYLQYSLFILLPLQSRKKTDYVMRPYL